MFIKLLQNRLSPVIWKQVLVIAGSWQEFKDFCNEVQIEYDESGKWEGYEFIYYSNWTSVRGLRYLDEVIKYGTWYTRKDIDDDYIKVLIHRY